MLSELLSESTTAEEVLQVIRAVSLEHATVQAGEAEKNIEPVGATRNDTVDETRSNAKGMFGGGQQRQRSRKMSHLVRTVNRKRSHNAAPVKRSEGQFETIRHVRRQ